LNALPELGERSREALKRLLPGAVTVLLPNPRGLWPLACGEDPSTVGLRVPALPAPAEVRGPVLQSSANRAGGADPLTLAQVPELIRVAADLVIDGGELPGTASTVVDLRRYEGTGEWSVVRAGAVSSDAVAAALRGQFHFDPATYLQMITTDIPVYERLQAELVLASGPPGAQRILELGTGTGETARRLLKRHPSASLVGVDESESMLSVARSSLPGERVSLLVGWLEDPLPAGPFDVVASALCVHHLDGFRKAELFGRVRAVLRSGGRFALADVVVPVDPSDAVTSLTPGFDKPSPLADQLAWLDAAGFEAFARWTHRDLAVVEAVAR
jgi:tRNA (cmo5U34)-methyltransferase